MRNPLGRYLRVAGVITAVTGGLIAGITPAQAGTPLNTNIPTRYTAQNLDWHQCAADEVNLPAGAPADLVKALQCATFGAPRDWDHPGQGPDLTIAVSRLAATGTATVSVITNPGGPGEPGRWFPIALAGQTALRAPQEVIGLEVRGTGKSTTISCGGDGADLAKLDDNADALAATEFATRCNDTRFAGGDRASLMRTSQRLLDQGLTIYGGNQLDQPCAFWPSHPKPAPAMTGRGVPPVLMVAADRDPWTPIEGVRNAHAAFQHSRLLTVTGEGDHGVYALTGNTAVDNIVNNFLVDGVLPPDESVPGMPLPTP